jgi:hypothetical protein
MKSLLVSPALLSCLDFTYKLFWGKSKGSKRIHGKISLESGSVEV